MRIGSAVLVPLLLSGTGPVQQPLWQADLQIRKLTVWASNGNLTARVVVGSEFGEAMDARLEVLLPVGVGIIQMGPGCRPGPSAPQLPSLRARVICIVGNLPAHASREYNITTTTPPIGVARRFGVVATSDTPDPKPGNNFAQMTAR